MEVQWTRPSSAPSAEDAILPPRGCFPVDDPSSASWEQLEGRPEESNADAANSYWPIFAVASPPVASASMRSAMKAHLWCDHKGRLHTVNGIVSTNSESQSSCLKSGKWHHITAVVDCVCGEMEVYLDGVCVHARETGGSGDDHRLKPPGIDAIDG